MKNPENVTVLEELTRLNRAVYDAQENIRLMERLQPLYNITTKDLREEREKLEKVTKERDWLEAAIHRQSKI